MLARLKPSPGTVVACVALLAALGGSAYAVSKINGSDLVDRSVAGKKLKRNTIKGSEVKESALGKVPKAAKANTAANISPPEAEHVVDTSGEPPFGSGWSNFSPSDRPPAAFYMDREGVVHLQGEVSRTSGTNDIIFTLPESYAPAKQQSFPAVGNGGVFATLSVRPTGEVDFDTGNPGVLHLNGITWRAGH